MTKLKILVVDDSLLFRRVLEEKLSLHPQLEVVGLAEDVYEARDMILALRPDALTLDVQMPKMDGIEFLKRLLPQYPISVVVVSSVSDKVFDAMNAGAVDFVCKPSKQEPSALDEMIAELSEKLCATTQTQVAIKRFKSPSASSATQTKSLGRVDMIAIGASTGGTEAIASILKTLNPPMPPIVIVQHMPPVFTGLYAKRMNDHCQLRVVEGNHLQVLENNCVYIAPGDKHMTVKKRGPSYTIHLLDTEKVSGHRPSVDVLFESVAQLKLNQSIGIILTGMGSDGAKGLLELRKSHGFTLGQDQKSCVVYGMPKVAYDMGAVVEQVALADMPTKLKGLL